MVSSTVELCSFNVRRDLSAQLLNVSAAVLIVVIVCVQACQRPTSSNPLQPQQTSPNAFDAYIKTDIPPADDFDFPVGDANASGPYKDIATGIEYHGWIREWDNSGPRHLS
jgi:hypothetical protein